MLNLDPARIFMELFALIIAIPVHEFAHALSAVNNGDDGPRRDGRLSILPWDHFDPFGAIFCVVSTLTGFGIGWGKPVLVNPHALKNPRWDMCKVAIWGPTTNLLLAIGFALPLRFNLIPPAASGDVSTLATLCYVCAEVNLALFFFNLIPIGPLDGAKVLVTFLPDNWAFEFSRFMQQWGFMLLMLLIVFGNSALGVLIGVPTDTTLRFLIGLPAS